MTILLIKTKNKVYQSQRRLHCLVAKEHKIKLEDVINVGFLTGKKEIWLNRKPY